MFHFFSQPTDEHEPRRLKTLALDSKFRFELVLDFGSRFEVEFEFRFEPRFEFELEFQFELEFGFQFFECTSGLGVTENYGSSIRRFDRAEVGAEATEGV